MDTLNLVVVYLALVSTAAPIYFYFLWQNLSFWQKQKPSKAYLTGLAIVILVLIFFYLLQPSWQDTIIGFSSWVKILGWALITLVVIIFAIAQYQIGFADRAFLPHLTGGKTDLIRTGLYGLVRHPMYSGLPLFIFGTFLATGYVVVLIPFIVLISTVGLFSSWEEEKMIEMLGDTYKDYQKEVPKFFPKIKGIKPQDKS